jgi:hypothetical protein
MGDSTKPVAEKRAIETEKLRTLLEKIDQFVPGPWAVETCGEKGDGAYMIGIAYRGDDRSNPPTPLSGFLPDADEDGEFFEYDRQELVAEVDFHNPGAPFVADLLWQVPYLARTVLEKDEETKRLKACLEQITLVDLSAMASRATSAESTITTLREENERLERDLSTARSFIVRARATAESGVRLSIFGDWYPETTKFLAKGAQHE